MLTTFLLQACRRPAVDAHMPGLHSGPAWFPQRATSCPSVDHKSRPLRSCLPAQGAAAGGAPAASGPAGAAPPNKILFVQNLPENSTEAMLAMLFQQFPGFREVRMVEARPGIAFVE